MFERVVRNCVKARLLLGAAAIAVCTAAGPVFAAESSWSVKALQIHPNFYMIAGAGANIAVQTGDDGTVLVDAGTREAADRVLAILKSLTDQPIRYILNSSGDADHVAGNGVLSKAGRSIFFTGPQPINSFGGASAKLGASIFAPVAVLQKVSAPTGQAPPFPTDVWPNEAFDGPHEYIYFNHEGIEVFHQSTHDDTDSIVFFRGSDVICAGDAIDTNRFPVIDVAHGGSIQAEIDALNHIIDLSVRPIPFVFEAGGTYIIPGHGRIYQQADVVYYRDMMVIIRDIVQDMINRGLSLGQIQAEAPAKAYERQYGAQNGPWTTNNFIEAIYQSLVTQKSVRGAH